jgi:hypothetical protein
LRTASAPFGGILGDFLAFFGSDRVGASTTTLKTAFAAQCDGGFILAGIFGALWRAGFDLAGENIADQVAELYGIVGCALLLSWQYAIGQRRMRAGLSFKLYHYRNSKISKSC